MTSNDDPIETPDPVHEDDEGWWFYDETWSNRYGPYESYEIAAERCADYALTL